MPYIAPIVEGHGECEALPALLYRIASRVTGGLLRVNAPLRVKAGSFLRDDDYFRKHVMLAAAKAAQEQGSVLIVLDCEDDCPARLGPELLKRAKAVRADVEVIVALAYREYETWFLTAARSLRGLHGLPPELEPPQTPEGTRDAKGWLSQRMAHGYDPIVHQLAFSRRFDLDAAKANASFARFYRRISELLMGSQRA
jgi:hypothetical protein